jgi:hypothetical protein
MRSVMVGLMLVMVAACSAPQSRMEVGGCPRVEMQFTGKSQRSEGSVIGFFDLTNHGPGPVVFDLWNDKEALLFGHPVEVQTFRQGGWEPYLVSLDEYLPARFELSLDPGQSQRVSVADPGADGAAFVRRRGEAEALFRVRLKDNRFKCTFWSEAYVPPEGMGKAE